jgi:GNAT superfamily N-acetyltransferase
MAPVGQLIRRATPADIPETREMLREYVAWIGLDLAFQEIDAELAGLPGEYVPPKGALFVVPDESRLVAMIGLRPFEGSVCEMKRLFVRPEGRGRHLGRALAERICETAAQAGYRRIRLDTLPTMRAARELYATLGFVPIAPYVFNPIAGTAFMERDLSSFQSVPHDPRHASTAPSSAQRP